MSKPRSRPTLFPPFGLYVVPKGVSPASAKALFDHFSSDKIEWFQRFGKRFPNTAHYNGHHCMATDVDHADVLVPILKEAMDAGLGVYKDAALGTLQKMRDNLDQVAVATMRHKPGWGLGAHIDVYAPDGEGLVLMVCVANTRHTHRTFRFSQTSKDGTPVHHDVPTPNGTVVIFGDEAYEEWMHESRKNPKQDGTCISLTVRLRDIDGYDGWSVPESVQSLAAADSVTAKRYRSHSYAVEKMNERLAKRRRNTSSDGGGGK